MGSLRVDKSTYFDRIFKAAKNEDRKTFRKLFLKLHDRDQNEVFHLMYPDNKKRISMFLSPEEFAEMFEFMLIEDQEDAYSYLPTEYFREVLDNLSVDDIVYFIERSEIEESAIIPLLSDHQKVEVTELLSYADETAGSIMTKEFIHVFGGQTLDQVINELRAIGESAESIYYVYVTDTYGILKGVVSLRELLLNPADQNIDDLMNTQLVTVKVDDDQEVAGEIMKDYDLIILPVISQDGKMQGIITIDDIIDVMDHEQDEDFHEFAGVPSQDNQSTIFSQAKSRSTWLIIFMFLGLLTGAIMGLFENTLSTVVLLSAFIPLIMNIAGSVGTQALAVSLKDDDEKTLSGSYVWELVKKEFLSGLVMGIISAIAIFIILMIIYSQVYIAFVVSISLLITISFSTVFGAVIPLVIDHFNIDSSVASGPLITTLNDAIAIIIYLLIATVLL